MDTWLLTREEIERKNRLDFELSSGDLSRPGFHFAPPGMWMNDVNGAYEEEGNYHLFYLHDPFSADGKSETISPEGQVFTGERKPNRVWGHTVTRDFVHWRYLPPALIPQRDKGEIKVISGSSEILPDHRRVILYTSVHTDEKKAGQWIAIEEGEQFLQCGNEPVIRRDLSGAPLLDAGFRDPFLFYQEDQLYALIAGCFTQNERDYAGLLLYKAHNNNCLDWHYVGILLSAPVSEIPYFECPKLFTVGDKWVLMYSPYGPPRYITGELDAAKCRFTPLQKGFIDLTSCAYATVNLNGSNGKRYLMSWIPGWHKQNHPQSLWGGCLSIPREVFLDQNNMLCQRPAKTIQELRHSSHPLKERQRMSDNRFCIRIPSFESNTSLSIFNGDKEIWQMEYCNNGILVDNKVYEIPDAKDLWLYWDVCVWELFISQGRWCITGMLDEGPQEPAIYSTGLISATIWQMSNGSCTFE